MKKTEPVLLSDLLNAFIRDKDLEQGLLEGRLVNAWRQVVGRDIAEYTTKLYIRDNRLYVSFGSSVARSEFFMRRAKVMDELNRIAGRRLIHFIVVG